MNGSPLGTTHGDHYAVHSHHIFPQPLLYKCGFDKDNKMHKNRVNEIANRAFLTASSKWEIGETPPIEYLPEIEEKFPGALAGQFVPMDDSLWKVENYREFLVARRKLIAEKINDHMRALITDEENVSRKPLEELIRLGESSAVEFKSTFQWDMRQGKLNKELRKSTLKTIAAFMNSNGGTVLIGVEDNGHVIGLDSDLQVLEGSEDKFMLNLNHSIADNLGVTNSYGHSVTIENVEDQKVCVLDVEKAIDPVFLKTEKGKIFFVRYQNQTRQLDAQEAVDYIAKNWGSD